jgi:hypothetical protein
MTENFGQCPKNGQEMDKNGQKWTIELVRVGNCPFFGQRLVIIGWSRYFRVTILNHGNRPTRIFQLFLRKPVIKFSSLKSVDTFDTFCHHFFGQKRLTDRKISKKS